MKTQIGKYTIITPDNFQKVKLPWFNEWKNDLLTTTAPQGRGGLRNESGFCCLGRLCEVQQRLNKKNCEQDENGFLMENNPCSFVLLEGGAFPKGCYIESDMKSIVNFIGCNDSLRMTFQEIAEIPLSHFFEA